MLTRERFKEIDDIILDESIHITELRNELDKIGITNEELIEVLQYSEDTMK